jgi:signal transduction histidine kinase
MLKFGLASLQTKLIVAFSAVALIPLVTLALLNKYNTQKTLTQNAEQSLFAAATQTALNLDSFIQNNLDDIRVEAQLPGLARYLSLPDTQRQGTSQEIEVSGIFRALQRRDAVNVLSYSLLDRQGRNVMDTDIQAIGRDVSGEDYFQQAIATQLPYVSSVRVPDSSNNSGSLYFSSPVWDKDGQIVGVLAVRYNATAIQQLVAQSNDLAGTRSFAILLDENQIRLGHGLNSDLLFKSITPLPIDRIKLLQSEDRLPHLPSNELSTQLPQLEKFLSQPSCPNLPTCPPIYLTTHLAFVSDELYSITVTTLNTQPWQVVFAQPHSVLLAPIRAQTQTALVLVVGIAVGVLMMAYVLGRRFAHPLTDLTQKVTQFTAGHITVRAAISSQDEIGVLASSFNTMAEQVGKLLQRLEERTDELEISQNITFAVSELSKEIREPEHLLQDAIALVLERFGLYQVRIYLVDETEERLMSRECCWQTDKNRLSEYCWSIPLNCEQSLIAKVARHRQTLSIQDLGDRSPETDLKEVFASTRCQVAVPLISRGRLLGVLDIQDDRSFHFSQSDLDTFETLGVQIANAFENARLFEAVQLAQAQERDRSQQLEQTLCELQQTQLHLIQSEKMSSLGQLVAGVAHEINNPVSFIFGNLVHAKEYMQNLLGLIALYQYYYPTPHSAIQAEIEAIELEFLFDDFPKLLASMQVGAERIQTIVLSLRTFSRMDESQMKNVNIHDGIDSTLMILQHQLKPKDDRPEIAVIKEYDDLPLIECYAGQLNQVFMNLLSNAIDAIDESFKGGHFSRHKQNSKRTIPSITIRTQMLAADRLEMMIADNGKGIPADIQPRLFDPFFTTKPVGKGTGMGLSISYQIITEKHGGTIQCISVPGQGTQFRIEIPTRQLIPRSNHPNLSIESRSKEIRSA